MQSNADVEKLMVNPLASLRGHPSCRWAQDAGKKGKRKRNRCTADCHQAVCDAQLLTTGTGARSQQPATPGSVASSSISRHVGMLMHAYLQRKQVRQHDDSRKCCDKY